MKRICFTIAFLFMISYCCAGIPAAIIKNYHHIIRLIEQGKAVELSHLISYPLIRQNPLPNITNAKQFIAYYSTLIDIAFKKQIQLYNDTDIFEHHGEYGLVGGPFRGEIWMDENGNITSINYASKKEQLLKVQLTKQLQKTIYQSVNTWKSNVLVAHTEKILIRVDEMKKDFRFVSWSHGRTPSQKPDLILYKGVEEAQGTEGGWTWTFKNGDWTYVVDDREMAETVDQEGLFLELSYKDVLKKSIRLKEIK
jgi:hypothetical protein